MKPCELTVALEVESWFVFFHQFGFWVSFPDQELDQSSSLGKAAGGAGPEMRQLAE